MSNATVTVRELKNKTTGIDVAITACKEENGIISVKLEYAVLVVSRLSCFKSQKHKPTDVVQFVIKRSEEAFLQLHRIISLKFPKIKLPSVTPTGLALFKDVDVRQQKDELERFLKVIVAHPDTATYHSVLEFLGVNPVKAGNYNLEKSKQDENSSTRGKSEHDIFEEEVEDLDLFTTNGKTTAPQTHSSDGGGDHRHDKDDDDDDDDGADLLFSGLSHGGRSKHTQGTARLFDDQDYGGGEGVSELALPGTLTSRHIEVDDNHELLSVEDDLDQLLNIGKKKPQNAPQDQSQQEKSTSGKPSLPPKPTKVSNKPNLPPKPGKPAKPKTLTAKNTQPVSNNNAKDTGTRTNGNHAKDNSKQSSDSGSTDLFGGASITDDFGTDDIMKYIQDNSRQEEEVDLFS